MSAYGKQAGDDDKTIACPREDSEGNDCKGTVTVTLEYEPDNPNFGADADGRRGIYVNGYWTATAAESCSLGHALELDEKVAVEQDAIDDAESEREDEYLGPDGPENDY